MGRARQSQAESEVANQALNGDILTSILAVDILFYYVEKDKLDKAKAHEFISSYEILNCDKTDYLWAREHDQGDFEDALQVACARRHGCSLLITCDQKMKSMYGKYIAVRTVK